MHFGDDINIQFIAPMKETVSLSDHERTKNLKDPGCRREGPPGQLWHLLWINRRTTKKTLLKFVLFK